MRLRFVSELLKSLLKFLKYKENVLLDDSHNRKAWLLFLEKFISVKWSKRNGFNHINGCVLFHYEIVLQTQCVIKTKNCKVQSLIKTESEIVSKNTFMFEVLIASLMSIVRKGSFLKNYQIFLN